jgi:hypothetical protein
MARSLLMIGPVQVSVCFMAALRLASGCAPSQTPIQSEATTGLARAALDNPAFQWDSTATPTLTLYYQPDSYAADHAATLKGRAEEARARALAMLGEVEFPHGLRRFYVNSRQEMAALEYLIQTNGLASFRRLWLEGTDVASIYAKPARELGAEWHVWVRAAPDPVSREELTVLRKHGCG